MLGIADRRLLVELAGAALDRDAGAALRLVARAADRGVDFGELGRSFLGFLRDLEVIARVRDARTAAVDLARSRRRDARGDRGGARAGGAGGARAVPGAVRSLGARGRRGVAPADAAPAVRDGGAGPVRRGADGAARRSVAAARRAREARLRGGGGAGARRPSRHRRRRPPAPAASRPAASPAPRRHAARRARGAGPGGSAARRRPRPPAAPAAPPRRRPFRRPRSVSRAVAACAGGVRGARGPRLASLLAHAEVVSLCAGELTLAFASKRDAELADKARAEIELGASAALGRAAQGDDHHRGAGRRGAALGGRQRRPTPRTPIARTANRKRASIP